MSRPSLLANARQTPENPYLRRRALARARATIAGGTLAREPRRGYPYWRVTLVTGALVSLTTLAAAAVLMLKNDTPPAASGWMEEPARIQTTATPKAIAGPGAPPHAIQPFDPQAPSPLVRSTKQPGAATHAVRPRTVSRADVPRTAALAENNARELKILQPAREAVARGDFSAALRAVVDHERTFPNGQLKEEREALRVRSLIGLQRRGEAREVALAFHKRYPHSILLSPMKNALERNP